MYQRDGSIQKGTNTSIIKDREPIPPRGKLRPVSKTIALKYNPIARTIGITLPPDKGSHEVLLTSYRSTVLYYDITMIAREFGVEEVRCTHPGHDLFNLERPFLNQRFDFVICDGQVLRTHKRPEYREPTEANRLTSSQLIFALQSIRHGGTNYTVAQDRVVGYHRASLSILPVLRYPVCPSSLLSVIRPHILIQVILRIYKVILLANMLARSLARGPPSSIYTRKLSFIPTFSNTHATKCMTILLKLSMSCPTSVSRVLTLL